jgi:hypothetical protein
MYGKQVLKQIANKKPGINAILHLCPAFLLFFRLNIVLPVGHIFINFPRNKAFIPWLLSFVVFYKARVIKRMNKEPQIALNAALFMLPVIFIMPLQLYYFIIKAHKQKGCGPLPHEKGSTVSVHQL